jgi:hypothetical protein
VTSFITTVSLAPPVIVWPSGPVTSTFHETLHLARRPGSLNGASHVSSARRLAGHFHFEGGRLVIPGVEIDAHEAVVAAIVVIFAVAVAEPCGCPFHGAADVWRAVKILRRDEHRRHGGFR